MYGVSMELACVTGSFFRPDKCAAAVFCARYVVALVTRAIAPSLHSAALLLVGLPLTSVVSAVRMARIYAGATGHTVAPLAHIYIPANQDQPSDPMGLAVDDLAFVERSTFFSTVCSGSRPPKADERTCLLRLDVGKGSFTLTHRHDFVSARLTSAVSVNLRLPMFIVILKALTETFPHLVATEDGLNFDNICVEALDLNEMID